MMTSSTRTTPMLRNAAAGALAGLVGGVVFGILLGVLGAFPGVAKLAGSTDPTIGAVVHMVISAALGVGFALIAPWTRVAALLTAGAGYGVLWWVLGPLVLMPAILGAPLLHVTGRSVPSLLGHIAYGLVTATVLFVLRRRGDAPSTGTR